MAQIAPEYEVRRIRAHEWRELRDLRLTALVDTPIAFGELHAEAARLDDDAWRERARLGAAGDDRAMFVAIIDGRFVGMTGVFLEGHPAPTVIAVFVRPEARGIGVAEALFGAVMAWAAATSDADVIRLTVHEDNHHARRLYERLGFTLTGWTEPYVHDHSRLELEMTRPLR